MMRNEQLVDNNEDEVIYSDAVQNAFANYENEVWINDENFCFIIIYFNLSSVFKMLESEWTGILSYRFIL